jgi:hypothetical protein
MAVVLFYSFSNLGIELNLLIVLSRAQTIMEVTLRETHLLKTITVTALSRSHSLRIGHSLIKVLEQPSFKVVNSTLPVAILEVVGEYGYLIALSQSAAPDT